MTQAEQPSGKCPINKLLLKLEACEEAIDWSKGKSLRRAWTDCDRANWMCWLLVKMVGQTGWPDKSIVRHCLVDCAETAEKYTDDKRVHECNQVARRYADGKATDKELNAARAAAWAAEDDAANNAALATARAAAWAAYRNIDRDTVWAAANNAALATADDAASDAALKHMAGLIRKRIPYPIVEAKP